MLRSELTTISEFRHPGLASTVAVVGNRHGGSKSYIESLGEQLAIYEAEGSAMHYEEIRYVTDEELASESHSVQMIYHMLEFLKETSNEDINTNDGANIEAVIKPKMGVWEIHDATTLELANYIHKRPIQQLALATFSEIVRIQETNAPETRLAELQDKLYYATGVLAFTGLYSALVTYRNSIALKAVDNALEAIPDQDVTLLWGQDHVPGLTSGLQRRGFQRTYIAAYSPDEQPSR